MITETKSQEWIKLQKELQVICDTYAPIDNNLDLSWFVGLLVVFLFACTIYGFLNLLF